jgi:NADPH:quinone reductase-like Zn-dependent oxidoreductase
LTLGSEVSGTVAALGAGVRAFALADAIYGATNDQFVGGYAEYALVEAGKIARASPPRSTLSRRRAFRSLPSPRGRCYSSTRGSDRDKQS